MSGPLRVLMVEDSETDAKLVAHALRSAGHEIELERVEEAAHLIAALARQPWDLVISDWTMPRLRGRDALAIVKAAQPDAPFIIVSGTVGEDKAVEAMRAGAQDYVLKGNLTRLPSAVERELRESKARRSHRQAQETLRESEARYRVLFESSPLPKWLYDVETLRFLAVNDAAVQHYGYSREEFLQMSIKDIRPPEDVEALVRGIEEVGLVGLGPKSFGVRRHRKRDGTVIDVEVTGHTFPLDGRVTRLITAQDITERRRTEEALRKSEEQLRQAQKMEAIGQLTGGVAHDFNNLLSIILSYSGLLADDLPADDPRREYLLEIRTAGQRASALTQQLLAFSRRQLLQPRVLDLSQIVGGMEKMLRRLIGEDVELVVAPAPEPALVSVDPGQMEQVIMNLAVNARDAMPTGGKLTIEIGGVELDEACQSAGTIWLQSEPGAGTTFRIYLPVAEAAEAELVVSRPAEPTRLQGSETVLLVEDEESVRKLVRSILQKNGYRVLEAMEGTDALRIAEQQKAIDLLLTDVVMPRMSGAETAARLLAVRPGLKLLYMSGYTDDAVVLHGVQRSEAALVQKPITPELLLSKVREVLDSPLAPASEGTAAASRRARVLVIDDEPMMRRLVLHSLCDHEVVLKGDAREALALLAAGESFDVILCDLNMPGMNGMEFHAALTPLQAKRVLFVTGGALADPAEQFLKQAAVRVLTKPVEVGQLRAAVAAVLEPDRK